MDENHIHNDDVPNDNPEATKEEADDYLVKITGHVDDDQQYWAFVAIKSSLIEEFNKVRTYHADTLTFDKDDDQTYLVAQSIVFGQVIKDCDGKDLSGIGDEPPEDVKKRVKALFEDGIYQRAPRPPEIK